MYKKQKIESKICSSVYRSRQKELNNVLFKLHI